MTQKTLSFTPEKLAKLKRLYDAHKGRPEDVFIFEGDEILVKYAKYMIDYLESRLPEVEDNSSAD